MTCGARRVVVLAAILAGGGSVATAALAPGSPVPEPVLVQRSAYLMGTRADLVIWSPTRSSGAADLDRALAVLEASEEHLSTWRTDSQLSAINRAPLGQGLRVDGETCESLARVATWHEATSGAFDPAVGALVDAWDLRGAGRVPTSAALATAVAASGWRHFRLDRADATRCTVTRTGPATLDAGAFGKGEALDRAARVLAGRAWQIDLGGQIAVGVPPPGQAGWPVALADPGARHRAVLDLVLPTGSLATSGGSERDLDVGGRRVGHVLDPRTGRPASFDGSVTVWHERAFVADVLSTALYVMGPDEGLAWAEARGLAVVYLAPGASSRLQVRMTKAFLGLVAG